MRSILQPAIMLMESEAAAATIAEGAGHVSQCSAEGIGLDGSLVSKGGPAIAHQTKDMETSQQRENLELSFLVVNDKEGNKQLFVDLGKYKKCF